MRKNNNARERTRRNGAIYHDLLTPKSGEDTKVESKKCTGNCAKCPKGPNMRQVQKPE